jgi:hypothetical protein
MAYRKESRCQKKKVTGDFCSTGFSLCDLSLDTAEAKTTQAEACAT